jgi:hypothetical protein
LYLPNRLRTESTTTNFFIMLYLIIIILVILIAVAAKNSKVAILSNWHHLFDGAQFSSQEIYTKIEEGLKARKIASVQIRRTNLSEGGMFSSNREYLRINRNDIFYDICASPFGTGFFVSWWQLFRPSLWTIIISKIPFVNATVLNLTYYQADNEIMFKETVHHVVMDVINDLGATNGLRSLTELEQRPQEIRGYSK